MPCRGGGRERRRSRQLLRHRAHRPVATEGAHHRCAWSRAARVCPKRIVLGRLDPDLDLVLRSPTCHLLPDLAEVVELGRVDHDDDRAGRLTVSRVLLPRARLIQCHASSAEQIPSPAPAATSLAWCMPRYIRENPTSRGPAHTIMTSQRNQARSIRVAMSRKLT